MNNVLLILLGTAGFLTGNYLFIVMIPVLWWTFKDTQKEKSRVVYHKFKKTQKKFVAPILSIYSFNK